MTRREFFLELLICLVISILYVFIYSTSTSPLYPFYSQGVDSFQFLTIGKCWYNGLLPYKDVFDHKGPVIFFVNLLGYIIGSESRYGVCVVQVVALTVSLLGVIRFATMYKKSNFPIYLFVFLIALRVNYVSGNTVEEYCVPFLLWSTVGIFEWFEKQYSNLENVNKLHNPMWAFVYGITGGICLLTRATNFIPLCMGIIIIALRLLFEKEISNLCKNAIGFIVGFLVISLPFFGYFAMHKCLKEMFFAMIIFNAEYAKSREPWIINADSATLKLFFHLYFNVFALLLASIIAAYKRQLFKLFFYLMTFTMEIFFFFSNDLFWPYPMICVAQVLILICEVDSLMKVDIAVEQIKSSFMIIVLSTLIVFSFVKQTFFDEIISNKNIYLIFSKPNNFGWEELVDQIPDLNDTFVAYGGNDLKAVYVLKDVLPCYKYFVIQDWHSMFDQKVSDENLELIRTKKARWILCDNDGKTTIDSLSLGYEVYGENGGFTLLVRE